jgi:uncharacterized protein YjiS (DUF1127 family)
MHTMRMTASQPLHSTVPPLPVRLWERLHIWRQRVRGRRSLAELSDYELHDIGITPADCFNELSKPFWRG